MSKPRSKRSAGFSLVELMIAMLIFLVASMGLLPVLLGSLQANQNMSLQRRAQRLAGQAMTRLQVVAYDRLVSMPNETRAHGPIYIERQILADNPLTGQAQITVAALWRQQDRQHRYQLRTVRSAE